MRAYELILVLRSSLKDDERKKLLGTVKDLLGKPEITREDERGQKPLSYPIKRQIAGFYVDIDFETETEIPNDFEKKLLANDNVLRHLLLRNKKLKIKNKKEGTKQSLKVKEKEEKEFAKPKRSIKKAKKATKKTRKK